MNSSDVYQQRQGTSNLGFENECLIPALFAVRAICKEDVEDLWLASNMESMGAFDDVVLQLKYKNGRKRTYVIQLKHKKNNICAGDFSKAGGDYSISKYQNSFRTIMKNVHLLDVTRIEDITFVIYTTANLSDDAAKEFLTVSNLLLNKQQSDHGEAWLLNTSSSNAQDCVYYFEVQESANGRKEYDENFLSQFLIYIGQGRTNIVEQLIQQILNENFNSFNTNVVLNLLNYFRMWTRGELGGCYKLGINAIRLKIGELLLNPYLVEPKVITKFEKANIWNEFVNSANIITLINYNDEIVSKIWYAINSILYSYSDNKLKDGVPWESSLGLKVNEFPKKYKKHGLQEATAKQVGADREVTMKSLYITLWKTGVTPLVLKSNDEAETKVIFKALELTNYGDTSRRVILLFKEEHENWCDLIKNCKVIRNLADINDRLLIKKLLENLEVSLQGRKSIQLSRIIEYDCEVLKTVTTVMILQMLCQPLIVGAKYQKLQKNYIPRSISKLLVNQSVFEESDTAFVVKGPADIIDEVKQLTRSRQVIDGHNYFKSINTTANKSNWPNVVVLEEGRALNVEENAHFVKNKRGLHYLRYHNGYLEWFHSVGKVNEIQKYVNQLPTQCGTIVREDKILNHFCPGVTILSGNPGMGKTTMMNYLAENCMEDYWVVIIRLNNHYQYFEELQKYCNVDDIVKHFLEFEVIQNLPTNCTTFALGLISILSAKKKVLFLIDDFDEVSWECAKKVVTLVNFLDKEQYRVWVSTRPVKSSYLERKFNKFSLGLTHVTIEDQKRYLKDHLLQRNKQDIDKFVTKLLDVISKSFSTWDLGFLSVPLHLHMIAEVFAEYEINDLNRFETLSTLDLYEKFITKKIDEYWRRTFGKCRTASNRKRYYKELELIKTRHAKSAMLMFYPKDVLTEMFDYTDTDQFLVDTREGEENIGIIISVNDVAVPKFAHQTFAEYLAAKFLSQNWQNEKTKPLLRELFTEKLMVIRQLFDRFLAEDRPLHLAVLDKNLNEVKKFMEKRKHDSDLELDRGGRTPLHLAAAWGARHASSISNTKCINTLIRSVLLDESEHKVSFSDPQAQKITEILVCVPEFFEKIDDIFGWYPTDYAIQNYSLDVFDIMHASGRPFPIMDFFDNDSLTYYCVRFGYKNILATIPVESYIHLFSSYKNLLQIANDTSQNSLDTIELLLSKCNSMLVDDYLVRDDTYGNNVLTYAAVKGNIDIFKKLLMYKVDLNKINVDGLSPLHVLVFYGHVESLKELLQKENVDLNLRIHNKNKRDYSFQNLGHTALYLAANDNNVKIVKLLIENGANINLKFENGRTVLHAASINGCHECMEELITSGAEIDAVDDRGRTPLQYAAQKGNLNSVNQLLRLGADVNKTDGFGCDFTHYAIQNLKLENIVFPKNTNIEVNRCDLNGRTPLHYISRKVKVENIQFLLRSSTDYRNRRHYGKTLGHRATNTEKVDNMKYLLNFGAHLNNGDHEGRTPLHYAIEEGNLENIECLLKLGADINKADYDGRTSLYQAIEGGKLNIMKCILKFGPNINKGDKFKVTPLHLATERGFTNIVGELIKCSDNLNLSTVDGCTPLLLAINNKNEKLVKLFLANKANANKGSYDGFMNGKANCISRKYNENRTISTTPLQLAIQLGNIAIVRSLLKSNVKINQINKNGWTCLHFAADVGYSECVEELLNNGAVAHLRTTEGYTPFHLAAKHGHYKTLEILLKSKASNKVNQGDNKMRTPLHSASFYGHLNCVKILIENGADTNSISNDGFTPLNEAANQGNLSVKLYLEQVCNYKQPLAVEEDCLL